MLVHRGGFARCLFACECLLLMYVHVDVVLASVAVEASMTSANERKMSVLGRHQRMFRTWFLLGWDGGWWTGCPARPEEVFVTLPLGVLKKQVGESQPKKPC